MRIIFKNYQKLLIYILNKLNLACNMHVYRDISSTIIKIKNAYLPHINLICFLKYCEIKNMVPKGTELIRNELLGSILN